MRYLFLCFLVFLTSFSEASQIGKIKSEYDKFSGTTTNKIILAESKIGSIKGNILGYKVLLFSFVDKNSPKTPTISMAISRVNKEPLFVYGENSIVLLVGDSIYKFTPFDKDFEYLGPLFDQVAYEIFYFSPKSDLLIKLEENNHMSVRLIGSSEYDEAELSYNPEDVTKFMHYSFGIKTLEIK